MPFFESSSWKGSAVYLPTLPKCGACGLLKTCQSPKIAPAGSGEKKILYVGEAPGREEDEQGRPFVGEAGKTLRRLLDGIGEDLEDGTVSNSCVCKAPNNEILPLHIESCRPNLNNLIRKVKPEVIVLLGASAVQSVIAPEWNGDVGPIGRWAGWKIPSPTFGAWVCPTYHPSFINRQKEDPALVKIVTGHLKAASRLLGTRPKPLKAEDLSAQVEVITDPAKGAKRIAALTGREGRLAFDFETTGLKPEPKAQRIHSVSFCFEGKETFATPVTPDTYPALRAVLENSKLLKIGSNLRFEHRWALKKLGVKVAGWYWDTLLAAHVLDNRRGVSGIKFQAYVRFGVGEYNQYAAPFLKAASANEINTIDRAPLRDVLLYCGLDSLLEYKVALEQRKEMGF